VILGTRINFLCLQRFDSQEYIWVANLDEFLEFAVVSFKAVVRSMTFLVIKMIPCLNRKFAFVNNLKKSIFSLETNELTNLQSNLKQKCPKNHQLSTCLAWYPNKTETDRPRGLSGKVITQICC
jgi:hypothetical protein